MEIRGNSQRWGDASSYVKDNVKSELCALTQDLSEQDRSIFLAIAQFESGLNPDAKASTTTASGIFQIVKNTAKGLGAKWEDIFNIRENIKAALKLFHENMRHPLVPKHGVEREIMLYALHHDGPSLSYGGIDLARDKFLRTLQNIKKEEWCD